MIPDNRYYIVRYTQQKSARPQRAEAIAQTLPCRLHLETVGAWPGTAYTGALSLSCGTESPRSSTRFRGAPHCRQGTLRWRQSTT